MRISSDAAAHNAQAPALAVETLRGLSPRSRVIAATLTFLLLVSGGIALALADALPTFGGQAKSVPAGGTDLSPAGGPLCTGSTTQAAAEALPATVIAGEWDGPAVHLDWAGAEYARAEATFIGDRRASPGDRVVRTLNVSNAGPGEGVAAVTLDLSEVIPQGSLNPHLAQDVTLFWDIAGVTGEDTFAALNTSDRVNIAEVAIAQGATVPVTIGFAMDAGVETSHAAGAGSTVLSVDVGVNLTGETTPDVPSLSLTGASGGLVLLFLAAALVLVGVVLFARRRPREDEQARIVYDQGALR